MDRIFNCWICTRILSRQPVARHISKNAKTQKRSDEDQVASTKIKVIRILIWYDCKSYLLSAKYLHDSENLIYNFNVRNAWANNEKHLTESRRSRLFYSNRFNENLKFRKWISCDYLSWQSTCIILLIETNVWKVFPKFKCLLCFQNFYKISSR